MGDPNYGLFGSIDSLLHDAYVNVPPLISPFRTSLDARLPTPSSTIEESLPAPRGSELVNELVLGWSQATIEPYLQ